MSLFVHLDHNPSIGTHIFDFKYPTVLPNTILPVLTKVCMRTISSLLPSFPTTNNDDDEQH